MAFIGMISDEQASPPVAELFEGDRARLGYVPNFARVFSHRPAVYAAWQRLNGAIKEGMDQRRYELATVAAARRLRSSYCALAHGAVLANKFDGASTVRAPIADHASAGLDPWTSQ